MLRQRRPRGISLHLFQLNFPGKRGRPPSWQQRQRACENVTTRYAGAKGASASNAADKTHILAEIGDRRDEVNGSIQVLLDTGMSTSPLREAAARGVDVRGAADLRWSHCVLGLVFWLASIACLYEASPALGIVDFVLFLLCTCLWIKSDRDQKAFIGMAMAKFFVFFTLQAFLRSTAGVLQYDYRTALAAAVPKTLLAIAGRGRTASVPCVGPWIAQVLGPGCRLRMRPVNKAGKASSSNGVVQQQPKVDSNLHADASQGHAVEEDSASSPCPVREGVTHDEL
mmetsp:Transcript_7291/g.18196  ORF Transcript_7291/g.18196 Transcript_7291/m.18196 type:complete len:284 (-) Transcript_7291:88-939(-)